MVLPSVTAPNGDLAVTSRESNLTLKATGSVTGKTELPVNVWSPIVNFGLAPSESMVSLAVLAAVKLKLRFSVLLPLLASVTTLVASP